MSRESGRREYVSRECGRNCARYKLVLDLAARFAGSATLLCGGGVENNMHVCLRISVYANILQHYHRPDVIRE